MRAQVLMSFQRGNSIGRFSDADLTYTSAQEAPASSSVGLSAEQLADAVNSMQQQHNIDNDIIEQCFNVFDVNKNGCITVEAFKSVCRELGGFPDSFTEAFFAEVDIAGNGQLRYDEFAAIVARYLLDDQ